MNNHDQTIETENAVTKAVDYAPLYSNQKGSVKKFTFGDGRSIVVSEGNPEFDFDGILPRDGILMLPDGSVSFASLDGDGAFDPKGDFAWAGSKIDPSLMELVAWFLRNGFGAADSASFPANFASNEGIRKALDEASRLFYMADCVGMRHWFGKNRKTETETNRKEAEPVVSENRNEADFADEEIRTEPEEKTSSARLGDPFVAPEITSEAVIETECRGRDYAAKIDMDFRSMKYVVKTGSTVCRRSAELVRESEGSFRETAVEIGPDRAIAEDVSFDNLTNALNLVTGTNHAGSARLFFFGTNNRVQDAYGTAIMADLFPARASRREPVAVRVPKRAKAYGTGAAKFAEIARPVRRRCRHEKNRAVADFGSGLVPAFFQGRGSDLIFALDAERLCYVLKAGSVLSADADLEAAERYGLSVDSATRTVLRDTDFETMNTLLTHGTGYRKCNLGGVYLADGTDRKFMDVFGTTVIEQISSVFAAKGKDFWRIGSETDGAEETESFRNEEELVNAETNRKESEAFMFQSYSDLMASIHGA